ncbi:HNH endonuclease signature motif containing protein [Treponema pectinovorum]|uniref:HNH endonuclease signature motif containing protein n=1 Tax=Treponema pectinovorum TaxID=164 RepID=UPI0011C93B9D|nr:HNH endonuclease signature motif containing protein [Treponema pectinovorum]
MQLKYCAYPNCKQLVKKGITYCSLHISNTIQNKSSRKWEGASRFGDYHNTKWYNLRKQVKKEHPFCAYCGERQRLEVHHIRSVRDNPELMYDINNLLVLCHSCHAVETRREIEQRRRARGGAVKTLKSPDVHQQPKVHARECQNN